MPWSLRLSYAPPRSAGKEASLLTRRRHSKLPPFGKNLSRFCPRVFAQNRHFSQKSVLNRPKIRALLWAYRARESAQMQEAVKREHMYTHTPAYEKQSFSNLSPAPLTYKQEQTYVPHAYLRAPELTSATYSPLRDLLGLQEDSIFPGVC